ncbi:MAG: nucleoside kinase [Bacteroidales bacterium]|nr:nucleoside kinase [Bacteroidales bacterium]
MIQIFCKNTNTAKSFPEGISLLEILSEFEFDRPWPIVSAKVNNVSQGLKYRAYHSHDVEFLDVRETSGMGVYVRSLSFLLCKAAEDVLHGCKVYIEHPISNGYFCNIHKEDRSQVTAADIAAIADRMRTIVSMDMPFRRFEVPAAEAVRIFSEKGYADKVALLETGDDVYSHYYMLGDSADYYYGRLLPSAGYLTVWGLEPYHEGVLLRIPDHNNPAQLAPFTDEPLTFGIFSENLRWNIIMGLANVGDVNKACRSGRASELIQVAEALQEKKIVQIAEEIDRRMRSVENPLKAVLITGPSSSGKTTFSKRLEIQLKACGLTPVTISTDDYFVNRVETPLFPDGSYDFDNFETVDYKLLERDVVRMMAGEEVEVPNYNFVTGQREYNGRRCALSQGSVLIIEGIHALNPRLLPNVAPSSTYKIFINTITSTSLDSHNTIPTSDNRLLRRIIRDYDKGAFTAQQTIAQWAKVCAAEEKWILPYRENADVMFNSSYLIEFAVLRLHAERILATVPKNTPEYCEAHRLAHFLHYFTPVPDKEIPPTSLLREFIGGNSFNV